MPSFNKKGEIKSVEIEPEGKVPYIKVGINKLFFLFFGDSEKFMETFHPGDQVEYEYVITPEYYKLIDIKKPAVIEINEENPLDIKQVLDYIGDGIIDIFDLIEWADENNISSLNKIVENLVENGTLIEESGKIKKT